MGDVLECVLGAGNGVVGINVHGEETVGGVDDNVDHGEKVEAGSGEDDTVIDLIALVKDGLNLHGYIP